MFSLPKPDLKEEKERIAPLEVRNTILEYADVMPESGNLDRTVSFTPAGLFNSVRTQRLKALLTAIVSGEPDKAKAILDVDPSLLLEKLEEKDYVIAPTGHKFNLKPYQAALAVEDTQMAEMIKPYFAKLQNEEEANRQYDEQYPKGWEAAEEKKWSPIFKQLDILLEAIRHGKDDITSSGAPDYIVTVKEGSSVGKELIEFNRLLDATLKDTITAGQRPFPPNLLLEPLQKYDSEKDYKDYFGGRWDDPRALFFIQKVIGYDGIQRFMPVNYVQAHQDWLDDAAEKIKNNQPQPRGPSSTSFKVYRSGNYVDVSFYPLMPRGTSGFNFALYGEAGRGGGGVRGGGSGPPGFSKLMSIKNSRLTDLTPPRHDYRP